MKTFAIPIFFLLFWSQHFGVAGESDFYGTWLISRVGDSTQKSDGKASHQNRHKTSHSNDGVETLIGSTFRIVRGDQAKVEWLNNTPSNDPIFASFNADSLEFNLKGQATTGSTFRMRKIAAKKLSGEISVSNMKTSISFEAILMDQGIWVCGNHTVHHAAQTPDEVKEKSHTYGCKKWRRRTE